MLNPQTLRFPKPLAAGDLIAVTAPSSGVPAALHSRLDLAIAALKQRGFRVLEGECLRQQIRGASTTPRQRADELMAFLTAPEIAAVMPPWGGNLAIELLDLIDFNALASSPAKWFSGFSDLSTLHLPLTTIAGWATVHGPNLMQFGASAVDETTAGLWALLTAPRDTDFHQRSSLAFERVGADWKTNPGANLVAGDKTQWKRLDDADALLRMQGRLIGGCLDTLSRLAGTRYGNVPAFIASSGNEGTLLYLENAELTPFEVARALHCLRMNGWFDGLHGILLGRNAAPNNSSSDDFTYMDAVHSALNRVYCPVLYDLDIGHLPPQLSLVNGALAKVEFAAGSGEITQHLR
ncbi:S66 family peptidase [Collimonas fungivorans]|uniref:S66 family peptidase n=1 Tax=Collimonas fungivorans TaxID=158899 RepID=UPI003FA36A40